MSGIKNIHFKTKSEFLKHTTVQNEITKNEVKNISVLISYGMANEILRFLSLALV